MQAVDKLFSAMHYVDTSMARRLHLIEVHICNEVEICILDDVFYSFFKQTLPHRLRG